MPDATVSLPDDMQESVLLSRIAALLKKIAVEKRPCRACGAELYFVRHANGKDAPYTVDGLNHFINCPRADEFRRRKAAGNR